MQNGSWRVCRLPRPEGSDAPHPVAYLEIDGRSLVPQGQFTLLVDGKEVYSRALSRPKTKNLLQRMVHRTAETWGTRLDLLPGRHEIVARIVPDGWTTGYQETITVVLKARATRSLHIVAGTVRREEISLSLD